AGTANISVNSGSNVTLNVSGAGTNLDGASGFIGQNGSPAVNINVTGGGSITRSTGAGGTVVGSAAGANVNMLVSGTNSLWSNPNGMIFGTGGTFNGTVSAGGKVEGNLL